MKAVLPAILALLLMPALPATYAQDSDAWDEAPPAAHPPDAQQRGPQDRPPHPPQQTDRPPRPRGGGPGGPPGGGFGQRRGAGPQVPLAAIIRMIEERRPELAERLRHLRQNDPERFRDVLAEALMVRLEDTLREERGRRGPRGLDDRGPEANMRRSERQREHFRRQLAELPELEKRGRQLEAELHELEEADAPVQQRERVGGELERIHERIGELRAHAEEFERHREQMEREERLRDLQRKHEELERRSHELARELRELRESGQESDRRGELREALERTVNEQFELRSELREFELRRIEGELERLTRAVEEMRRNLQRRTHEHDAIIERRIGRLLGDETEGW